jgi:hypothetical protein
LQSLEHQLELNGNLVVSVSVSASFFTVAAIGAGIWFRKLGRFKVDMLGTFKKEFSRDDE